MWGRLIVTDDVDAYLNAHPTAEPPSATAAKYAQESRTSGFQVAQVPCTAGTATSVAVCTRGPEYRLTPFDEPALQKRKRKSAPAHALKTTINLTFLTFPYVFGPFDQC